MAEQVEDFLWRERERLVDMFDISNVLYYIYNIYEFTWPGLFEWFPTRCAAINKWNMKGVIVHTRTLLRRLRLTGSLAHSKSNIKESSAELILSKTRSQWWTNWERLRVSWKEELVEIKSHVLLLFFKQSGIHFFGERIHARQYSRPTLNRHLPLAPGAVDISLTDEYYFPSSDGRKVSIKIEGIKNNNNKKKMSVMEISSSGSGGLFSLSLF